MAIPKTANEKDSFLGLWNYYRRLIPHFAEYAEEVYKHALELKVTATEVVETAFSKLKKELWDGVAVKLSNSLWCIPERGYMLLEQSSYKPNVKNCTLRSSTVKHSMLLNATTPPMNANCWPSSKSETPSEFIFSAGDLPYAQTMLQLLQFSIPLCDQQAASRNGYWPYNDFHSL